MGTIRFELRIEKTGKSGKAPLRIVYHLKGQRKYYSTGLKLFPVNWNDNNQQAVIASKEQEKAFSGNKILLLTKTEVNEINSDLKGYKEDIERIEKRFNEDRVPHSAAMVIDMLQQKRKPIIKKEATSKHLFDFIDNYINEHQLTREAGSLTVYKSLKTHLRDYQKFTGKKITFDNIDYKFFQSFQSFLVSGSGTTIDKTGNIVKRKPLGNTTTAKQLSTIKTFLNYAKKQGVNITDKYKDFTIKRENLEVIALTNDEFEKLYYMDLSNNKRLSQVRDVFCFACTTGLRYSDLNQLRREHIKGDEIKLTVKKTKDLLSIPLNDYSKPILSRYEGLHRPLPVISNQKLNIYIKELCQLAEINEQTEIVRFTGAKREATLYPKYELIGIHTGRKTFATLSLEKGMSAEEVMSVGGWRDYKSFKRYVKITEARKKVVMMKAWKRVKEDAPVNNTLTVAM